MEHRTQRVAFFGFIKRTMSKEKTRMQIKTDAKERQMLNFYYDKMRSEIFDEKDIYVFFILIRRFTESDWFTSRFHKENWIREIGDLIAHRERRKGKIYNSLKAVRKIDMYHSGKVPNCEGLQANEFCEMLNFLLEQLGYERLCDRIMTDVLLCVYSVLQLSQYVEINKKLKTVIGRVIIIIFENELCLATDDTENELHVVLSKIENIYLTTEIIKSKKIIFCSNPITVCRSGGKLIIEYNNEIL